MAQLSDDCFAFGGPLMSVDDAVGLIAARVTPVQEIETVGLKNADGRVLAAAIAAPLPLPPFTNSAVDGYAVRSSDLSDSEQRLTVAGRIQAGAAEVLVSSGLRWALMHELRGAEEPKLPELLARLSRVDLVIVEGFKREPHRKVEVHRAANGKPALFPDDPAIVGIATDTKLETQLPVVHLDDIAQVAAMMQAFALPVEDVLARTGT